MPRSGIAGLYGNSIFSFWGTAMLFSIVAATIYIPRNIVEGFPFLHILSSICSLQIFNDGHSDQCPMVSPHIKAAVVAQTVSLARKPADFSCQVGRTGVYSGPKHYKMEYSTRAFFQMSESTCFWPLSSAFK